MTRKSKDADEVQQTSDSSPLEEVAPYERIRRRSHYKCDFCNKEQEEVGRLIAGPNQVYICDECVRECLAIIVEDDEDFSFAENEVFLQQMKKAAAITSAARDAMQQIGSMIMLAMSNTAFLPSELPEQLVQAVLHVANTAAFQLGELKAPSEVDSNN